MKVFQYLILFVFAATLLYAVKTVPPKGALDSPGQEEVNLRGVPVAGAYYIEHAYEDDHTPNMVTVILADYRGFDTLCETTVIFAGAIACLFILRRRT